VWRKIFGSKWEKMVGDWRKLHSDELHNMCTSPNIIMLIKGGLNGQGM